MKLIVHMRKCLLLIPAFIVSLSLINFSGPTSVASSNIAQASMIMSGLHVTGNHLYNAANQPIQLRGVNRSGTEYMCTGSSGGPFDGPSDAASIDAMLTWHINAVRISLNEDCWLGINNLPSAGYSAQDYHQAIINYVDLLLSRNIAVILDLHWNAPGTMQSKGQQSMPDLDHAPAFWVSVANVFRGNPSIIFDLYNEPHPTSWICWRFGSVRPAYIPCSNINYSVVGMQTLVNLIRSTGSTNILMLGGLSYANNMTQWLANVPYDVDNNLMASFHVYNFTGCNTLQCWNQNLVPIMARYPLTVGEIGENDCQTGFINSSLGWFDEHNASYMAWGWATHDCGGFPSLITDYNGTPTPYGIGIRDHYQALANAN